MVELSKEDKYLSITLADQLINAHGIQSEDEVEFLPNDQLIDMLNEIQENKNKEKYSDTYLHTFKAILTFDVAYLLRSNRCCS